MKINILHRANPTGDSIFTYFKNSWDRISFYEFEMEGSTYLDITAEQGRYPIKLSINRARALMNSVNKEAIEEILTLNGIAANFSSGEIINKSYDVLLWDRSIISIRQIVYGKSGASKKYIEEKQASKMADLAKRVMYLLGLDYAMISITVNAERKIQVTCVDASPQIRDRDLYVLIQKLDGLKQLYQEGWPEHTEVKLGADPEFMIANTKNSKMVAASEFFPREGLIGCDNIRVPRRQQRPVAELRPKPDTSPAILFANIKQALEQANKMVPYRNIKWLAGSQPFSGYSIGGHIHFSSLDLNNWSLRALDNYLGLPVFLIENQLTAIKRRNKYGQLGDFRVKDYGGFEYRTPGSWLISPEISLAVLCLAKIISSNYRQLKQNCFIIVEAQRAFYKGDQQYFRPIFEDIWRDIQKLEVYNDYKNELQIIPEMIRSNTCWDEKLDIRKAWGLSTLYSKTYSSSRQTAKVAVVSTNINCSNNNRSNNTSNRRNYRSASNSNPTQIISTNIGGSGGAVNGSFYRLQSDSGYYVN